MCNQNWARLVLLLVLLSGFFLVIALAESSEKDETFISQFMAPSTGQANEQMVKILFLLFKLRVLGKDKKIKIISECLETLWAIGNHGLIIS